LHSQEVILLGKTNKIPKRKRCGRERRLTLAATWVKEYNGKRIIKGYAKCFAVDLPCAVKELEMLGVEIKEQYKTQVLEAHRLKSVLRRKAKAAREQCADDLSEFDENFAFIMGYTSGGAPYGITWEENEKFAEEDRILALNHEDACEPLYMPDVLEAAN
jgi:hypothetical protein